MKKSKLCLLFFMPLAISSLASCDSIGDVFNNVVDKITGNEKEEPAPTHEHVFSELHAKVEPTCLSTGTAAYYTCEGCDKIFNESKEEISEIQVLPALDHVPHHHDAVAASCTENGATEYWTCDREGDENLYGDAQCENVIQSIPVVPAKGHHPEKVNGQAATCSADGYKDYYECDCGALFEDAAGTKPIANLAAWKAGDGKIEKVAHSYATPSVEWNGKSATATATCENCPDEISETKDGSFVEDTEATCHSAQTGHYEVTFNDTRLGSARTDANTATGNPATGEHTYGDAIVTWEGKSATATAACTNEGCTDTISETKDGDFVEDTAATCCAAQTGHYEVTFNDTRLGSARTDANSVTGSAATGNHVYDYASKQVSWDGAKATVTAPCSTSGCTAVISEEKTGSYVKDSNSTCTAPEKGHYEVTFDNTNFGSASSTANSVDNGDPHAHTFGALIPQVDRHRDQDGMKAHYVCSECNGLFTEGKVAATADELKIANTYGTFESATDAQYVFDEPISVGEEVVFDFKINEASNTWVKFCLMDNSWENHTNYITILSGGKGENLPAGVKVNQLLDGYCRVTIDTGVVPCEGTLEQIDFMYIWGANSNATGSFEYDPIGGTVLFGESFTSGSWIYMIGDKYDLAGTVSTFDITFLTEGFIKFCFQEAKWGHESKYLQVYSDGRLAEFRDGVKVETIKGAIDGVVSRQRVTIDFNKVNNWAKTAGEDLATVSRLTISPDTTATGTLDINSTETYDVQSFVKAGQRMYLDRVYNVEEEMGASFEFKLADEAGQPYLSLVGSGKSIGNFQLTNTGLIQTYQGLTVETLNDGFVKVTMLYGNINRTNAEWKTIAENNVKDFNALEIHGSWGTPCDVEIRNFKAINEAKLENRGDTYKFAYPAEFGLCEKLYFEFKVEAEDDESTTKVMFNGDTKYVGDYGFRRNGLAENYTGFTCEALNDGYFAVTMDLAKLNRSNASWTTPTDNGITKIVSIQTHSSWGQGCPITLRNISFVKRNVKTFNAAAYVDLPVKYTAEEAFGKALVLDYKLEGASTHSDYAHIVLMNTGWKNISGEIDLFGDATCNKEGKVESLGFGWYRATVDVSKFNGDGSPRDAITNFRLEKFGGDATGISIDWNSLRIVDFDREYDYSAGGILFKGVQPIENWKTSGKKLVIECEKGDSNKGGQKFVLGLRDSSNNSVAQFTIRLDDHIAKKGNNGDNIFTGVQVNGNVYRYEIDLSVLDAMSSYTGAESVVSINADEAWMDMIVHSVTLCDK